MHHEGREAHQGHEAFLVCSSVEHRYDVQTFARTTSSIACNSRDRNIGCAAREARKTQSTQRTAKSTQMHRAAPSREVSTMRVFVSSDGQRSWNSGGEKTCRTPCTTVGCLDICSIETRHFIQISRSPHLSTITVERANPGSRGTRRITTVLPEPMNQRRFRSESFNRRRAVQVQMARTKPVPAKALAYAHM
jgi:hypothetical protein